MIWHKLSQKKPLAYKSGDWDGLKSDPVLVYTAWCSMHIAEMYEGVLDGREFCEFYEKDGYEIPAPQFWTEITTP